MKQFDLEQNIMSCWNICEDLHTVSEAVLENQLTTDDICNILVGLAELYKIKFDKTFNCFEDFIKEQRDKRVAL